MWQSISTSKAITGKKDQKKRFHEQLFMFFSQIFYEIMILYEFFFRKSKGACPPPSSWRLRFRNNCAGVRYKIAVDDL